jgi:hypothetical protein
MESVKIVFLSILAGILYGIVHDQITARICIEYFTVFHPRLIASESPTVLGLLWGVVATWWAGAILGVPLAFAARAGFRKKLAANDLLPLIARLLLLMAISAAAFGTVGFALASKGSISPPYWVRMQIPPSRFPSFMADWWAHNASYDSAFLGGLVMCFFVYRRRRSLSGENR